MSNRWDRRREREVNTDRSRVVALRDRMTVELQQMKHRLQGVEMAISVLAESEAEGEAAP